MKITVSPTVPEELDGICTIENASFSDPWSRRSFAEALENPVCRFFSAHGEGGVLIGYALISVLFEDAEILSVAVDEMRCWTRSYARHAHRSRPKRSAGHIPRSKGIKPCGTETVFVGRLYGIRTQKKILQKADRGRDTDAPLSRFRNARINPLY